MIPNSLRILWFLTPLAGLVANIILWPHASISARWSSCLFLALSLLSWGYLSIRFLSFRVRLFAFLRQLLAGEYQAGIRMRKRFSDEISRLEGLANRVAERLHTYDRLRADRVSIHARALDLLLDRSAEQLAAIDVHQELFLLNPAAQKALGIERKRFSFESVLAPDINKEFSDLFHAVVSGQKTLAEGFSWLQLPGMSEPVYIGAQLTPLRDRDETVHFALLSIKVPQAKKTPEA